MAVGTDTGPSGAESSRIPPMENHLILCATARLARALQLDHARAQSARGLKQWTLLDVMTVSQWLDALFEAALLTGELDAQEVPQGVLSSAQERMLWETVIKEVLAAEVAGDLFDIKGLACMAQEANQLLLEWRLPAPDAGYSEETRQFLAWRREFVARCRQSGWMEAARYFDWQLDMLARGVGRLPGSIAFAGFDRMTPQMVRLWEILQQRHVDVQRHDTALAEAGGAQRLLLADQQAECRAAVAWAKRQLAEHPGASIGIVVPELAKLRGTLARLLDDALHPSWVRPAMVEAPRQYDFSLGQPLHREPVVHTALALLQFFSQWRRQDKIEQQDFSHLLQQPYWSHAVTEADARAQLDARMRERLPLSMSMSRLVRFIRREAGSEKAPLVLAGLQAHISDALAILQEQHGQQLPSVWADVMQRTLDALEWPGRQRSLSSFEFQAIKAFDEVLQALASLDVLQQALPFSQALARLRELVQEKIHQPEAEGEVRLQVMGMLESVSQPLHGLWVMGMNDYVWPPPPRPNPLLPAAMQRQYGVPNADSAVQAAFAQVVHQRLLHSAQQVIFSSALKDGERELRPSPLLQAIPLADAMPELSLSLAQALAERDGKPLQWLDDHQAPPVEEGEHISGGTGLLKAQAVCPAWAYFQYRLHARALKAPVNGLDAAGRGTLVHLVLERFWRGRGLHDLQAMDEMQLEQALGEAVQDGLSIYADTCGEVLSEAFVALETLRLTRLLKGWLAFERMREQPFTVLASEQQQKVLIEGVEITLIIDRIDQLEDGSRIVIDYKTGRKPDTRNWAQSRITEPQLPVYAAFVLSSLDPADTAGSQGAEISAIAFAMVKLEEHGFAGLANGNVLPAMPVLDDKKTREVFSEEMFPDWHSVLAHWRSSITAVVDELKRGEAAVLVQDENELAYCEVLPLLRLPERRLQFEHMQQGGAQ
ncbi:DNA helicase/exodeoxyribonuclease V, subunit B [Methylobacillus flagellatus KT]|uniref:DNA helicase/exodeoxyribonuclease V, subunit B n=2 Tax=Methylobacillus flagellatus TaxID=405 RepID=Q1H0G7_METFK|nr:DNA helicase/exodeoxyribonuclease V, subunit B [Methylobacillus flagellatus KT]